MKAYNNPPRTDWPALTQRPQLSLDFLESQVRNILQRVRSAGDASLLELTEKYDGAVLQQTEVSAHEIEIAAASLSTDIKQAIQVASQNITAFHRAQTRADIRVETMPGVVCWRKSVPIQKVGIYIPGGTAPLFSTVLMLAIPARLAGCPEVILCTPPNRDGSVNPAILYAASLCGINRIFKVGGAQAIAALAYGTESIPGVYKIFGPGNQYVTKAKQLVGQEGIAIDMPAGPSEVLVIADQSADADFIAADLLSQAEHGTDSQVVLVTTSPSLPAAVQSSIEKQLDQLARKAIATEALQNSLSVTFSSMDDAVAFANTYAAEHVIIQTANPEAVADALTNAGSVFLGPWTPEAAGDYASGTNHTLPTGGFARAYSGVSLESFNKTITYQQISTKGIQLLGPTVEVMARAELLDAHRNAIRIRLNKAL
ncbi:MAG: histidinol dehydrogenase [Cyclobacteriaceae bacterium]|jgi:histidinol dehydrogenase|nr:histidinol dehydrogenase [Cytophagales bacterium]HNP78963.1 histidinol dehydrogenase [Cyclobacteriaceae bacterium]HQQ82929.1 histidinol dehydrogenase [Cyclobacteriaceae bacterium]